MNEYAEKSKSRKNSDPKLSENKIQFNHLHSLQYIFFSKITVTNASLLMTFANFIKFDSTIYVIFKVENR